MEAADLDDIRALEGRLDAAANQRQHIEYARSGAVRSKDEISREILSEIKVPSFRNARDRLDEIIKKDRRILLGWAAAEDDGA